MDDMWIRIVTAVIFIIMILWIYAMLKIGKISDERMAIMSNTCPDCGMRLVHEDGCLICRHCGFSPCR
jgi:hypothetical protein